jgi:hypothetical protein
MERWSVRRCERARACALVLGPMDSWCLGERPLCTVVSCTRQVPTRTIIVCRGKTSVSGNWRCYSNSSLETIVVIVAGVRVNEVQAGRRKETAIAGERCAIWFARLFFP